jgi:hypothetical protein
LTRRRSNHFGRFFASVFRPEESALHLGCSAPQFKFRPTAKPATDWAEERARRISSVRRARRPLEQQDQNMLSISDSLGRIRSDFSDAELATLSEAEIEALTAVIVADRAVVLAETDGRDNAAHIAKWAKTLSEAEGAYQASRPQIDRIDAARIVIETQRRLALGLKPAPAKVAAEDPKLVAAVQKADAALNAARTKGNRIKQDIHAKRELLSRQIMAWQQLHPFSPEDLIREHLARVQADNARIAAEGRKAAEAPVPTMSHLDAVMQAAGKKTGHNSINYGTVRKQR